MSETKILVLAKIREERGVHGSLKIIRRGDMLERFGKNARMNLYRAAAIKDGFLQQPEYIGEYSLKSLEPLGDETAQLTLSEVTTRDDAAKLTGLFVGMELTEARKKFHDPEDPYLFEYIGCEVFDGAIKRGEVDRVEEFNGKQWLIVSNANQEVMVPLQGPFVLEINLEKSAIQLVEGNGLFEFDETA